MYFIDYLILSVAKESPLLILFVSIALAIGISFINWHPKLNKVIMSYLSFGVKDEKRAEAIAKDRMFWLNAITIALSGVLFVSALDFLAR